MIPVETQKHIRRVGLIYILWGCIGLMIFTIATYVGINDFIRIIAMEPKSDIEGKVLILILVGISSLLLFSLAYIFVGRAIRSEKQWALRVVGFILAIIALPSFPVGTAIGIYSIWALNNVFKNEPTKQSVSLTE